jgi:hypothetical protein
MLASRVLEQEQLEKWYERFDDLPTEIRGARRWISRNCGSHEKLDAILHLHGQVDLTHWLRLLGEFWSAIDTNETHTETLVWIFREWLDNPGTVIPQLMSRRERAAFRAPPDQIIIYRGCGLRNKTGLSWSMRRQIAERFPFHQRYYADQPRLLTAQIPKRRAAAIKLDRNEEEIIVVGLTESEWSEELLDKPPTSLEICV